MGGTSLPRLNSGARPIANKYCEGKMKSTLKRELKVPETDRAEGNGEEDWMGCGRVEVRLCSTNLIKREGGGEEEKKIKMDYFIF